MEKQFPLNFITYQYAHRFLISDFRFPIPTYHLLPPTYILLSPPLHQRHMHIARQCSVTHKFYFAAGLKYFLNG